MSIVNEILERAGLKYEELNSAERETLNSMLDSLNKSEFSLGSVREYIAAMKEAVEKELTETTHNSKQDLFLKARLKNYMLLAAFLETPEKAKKALERSLAGMVGKK